MIFDRAPRPYTGPMASYITTVWGQKLPLAGVEPITVNGMEAATAAARVNTRSGPRDIRLVAIRADAQSIYRFLFVTPPALTERLAAEFRRTTHSFRRLDPQEAAAIRPLRVRVVTVGPRDTPETLARRMPQDGFELELFRVLNMSAQIRPGEKVKIVAP
jgi:predicted Zn-dependent protease